MKNRHRHGHTATQTSTHMHIDVNKHSHAAFTSSIIHKLLYLHGYCRATYQSSDGPLECLETTLAEYGEVRMCRYLFSCVAMSFIVKFCLVMPHLVLSRLVLPFVSLSFLVMSCLITARSTSIRVTRLSSFY